MTETIVTPQTVIQTVEIDQQQIAVVKEQSVHVVTVGTQGPPGPAPSGLSGSFNISVGGTYGGVFNIRLVDGIVQRIGIYGM
jgi:hypothetical protein